MGKNVNPPAPAKLGDLHHFMSGHFVTKDDPRGFSPSMPRVGKVIYIHATHRYFTVEYEVQGGKRLRESIKF